MTQRRQNEYRIRSGVDYALTDFMIWLILIITHTAADAGVPMWITAWMIETLVSVAAHWNCLTFEAICCII